MRRRLHTITPTWLIVHRTGIEQILQLRHRECCTHKGKEREIESLQYIYSVPMQGVQLYYCSEELKVERMKVGNSFEKWSPTLFAFYPSLTPIVCSWPASLAVCLQRNTLHTLIDYMLIVIHVDASDLMIAGVFCYFYFVWEPKVISYLRKHWICETCKDKITANTNRRFKAIFFVF